jgi:hypothetical protein
LDIQTPAQQLFFTTVRIEASSKDKQGTSTGTAFIFSYPYQDGNALFLVTNKHVVADSDTTKFFFTESDGERPLIGQRFDIELQDQAWFGHPAPNIDITITPLIPIIIEVEKTGKHVFFKAIPHSLIPTSSQLNELDALEQVTFVGYPNGIFDMKNLLPILRRGTTASPLQIDYEGEPVFLVDASVFPGSSGSPVFICDNGGYTSKGNFVVGSRLLFLGVIASVLIREEHGQIGFVPIPTTELMPIFKTYQMIDLGVVYKASTVIETIEAFLTLYQKGKNIPTLQDEGAVSEIL